MFFFSLASVVEATIPCADPRGCPDLVSLMGNRWFDYAVSVQTFAPESCAVQEGMVQPGTRKLLRFTASFGNQGAGDLIIGKAEDHPEWFTYAPCHNHYHFIDYADYRLWDLAHTEMIASNKAGFCVIDTAKLKGNEPPKYFTCMGDTQVEPYYQGLSKGWVDQYGMGLDGQWFDITDLLSGSYLLEVEVNDDHLYTESNYSNNTSTKVVVIP